MDSVEREYWTMRGKYGNWKGNQKGTNVTNQMWKGTYQMWKGMWKGMWKFLISCATDGSFTQDDGNDFQ